MRRDTVDIIHNILLMAKKRTSKTRILYGANLSFKQLSTYLDLLIDKELLASKECDKKICYKTTEKGYEFLVAYMNLQELLNNNERDSPKVMWLMAR
jgi:predicted transcriptional regulator